MLVLRARPATSAYLDARPVPWPASGRLAAGHRHRDAAHAWSRSATRPRSRRPSCATWCPAAARRAPVAQLDRGAGRGGHRHGRRRRPSASAPDPAASPACGSAWPPPRRCAAQPAPAARRRCPRTRRSARRPRWRAWPAARRAAVVSCRRARATTTWRCRAPTRCWCRPTRTSRRSIGGRPVVAVDIAPPTPPGSTPLARRSRPRGRPDPLDARSCRASTRLPAALLALLDDAARRGRRGRRRDARAALRGAAARHPAGTAAAADASTPLGGEGHGRPTSADAAHRAHDRRRHRRRSTTSSGPASRCRGRRTRSARSSRPTGWRTTWWPRVEAELVAYGGIWLMVDEAHVTTFAVLPDVAPARRRRAADAGADGALRVDLGARGGDPRGPAQQRGGAPAVPAVRLPAGGRPAALLLGQRRGRAHHDHRAARLARTMRQRTGRRWPSATAPPTRSAPPRATRTGRERPAAGHRDLLRRDVGRGRRGRPAHPRQRRGQPGRAPRARPAASCPRSPRAPTCAG